MLSYQFVVASVPSHAPLLIGKNTTYIRLRLSGHDGISSSPIYTAYTSLPAYHDIITAVDISGEFSFRGTDQKGILNTTTRSLGQVSATSESPGRLGRTVASDAPSKFGTSPFMPESCSVYLMSHSTLTSLYS